MIEVYPKLFVGTRVECVLAEEQGWAVLHAAKTCHQGRLGYATKLDQHDPEYLVSAEGNQMYLNLVDAPFEPSVALVEAAMGFLTLNHYVRGNQALVHCDHGVSRAPSLALLYLVKVCRWKSVDVFKLKYPGFAPRLGMQKMLKRYGVIGAYDEDLLVEG